MAKTTAEEAIREITRHKNTIESIKGAKSLNRQILTNMGKKIKFLKGHMIKDSDIPGLMLKESKHDFEEAQNFFNNI